MSISSLFAHKIQIVENQINQSKINQSISLSLFLSLSPLSLSLYLSLFHCLPMSFSLFCPSNKNNWDSSLLWLHLYSIPSSFSLPIYLRRSWQKRQAFPCFYTAHLQNIHLLSAKQNTHRLRHKINHIAVDEPQRFSVIWSSVSHATDMLIIGSSSKFKTCRQTK